VKISYRWLREYVDTDLPAAELADRLTNAGIPFEGATPVVEGLAGVAVGEIEAIERELGESRPGHVNRLCRVALPDRKLSVIWGAPNVAPGLRTAVAPPGATLPGGRTIAVTTIRGVVSEGMLCSERELGISEDNEGILALPADAPRPTRHLSRARRHHLRDRDHAQPAGRAVHRGRGARWPRTGAFRFPR
jgi:phenylalanyl-tRNA synthetase beta chain